MAQRRAPAGGYDFPWKREYRRNIWNLFARAVRCPKRAKVLLMPSNEGDEIEVAVAKGFRLPNIHVVDYKAATVAHLRRRFPGLGGTYGCSIDEALVRAGTEGIRFEAVNADLTSCLSRPFMATVMAVGSNQALAVKAFVAVTTLRGREGTIRDAYAYGTRGNVKLGSLLRDCPDSPVFKARMQPIGPVSLTGADAHRMRLVRACLAYNSGCDVLPVRCGAYPSGKQTMLWGMFAMERVSDVAEYGAVNHRGSFTPLMDRIFGFIDTAHEMALMDDAQLSPPLETVYA